NPVTYGVARPSEAGDIHPALACRRAASRKSREKIESGAQHVHSPGGGTWTLTVEEGGQAALVGPGRRRELDAVAQALNLARTASRRPSMNSSAEMDSPVRSYSAKRRSSSAQSSSIACSST